MSKNLIASSKLILPMNCSFSKINIVGFSLDNFKNFDPEAYTILCHLGETCDGLKYFPYSSKITLNTTQYSYLIDNFEQFIPNLSKNLGINQEAAIGKSIDFFSDKVVLVQPTGVQGSIYNAMRFSQNSVPMMYTSEAVSLLKASGMGGPKMITLAPLTFVGATYIGSIFFSYCGSIAGNNPLGSALDLTSFVLSRPMRGIEIVLNGLILRPISNVVGLPFILNGTQEVLHGKGFSIEEYTKIEVAFKRIQSLSLVKKVKKIYNILRERD